MAYEDRNYYRPAGFGGFSFFPPVIKNLLIINGVVFFLQFIVENISFGGVPGWFVLNNYFALNPVSGEYSNGVPFNFQIWQLITYQFMHGGFSHIFFNMFMLWMFGMEIENMWGSKKFLIFYLTGGVVAGLFQLFLSPLFGSVAPTIGASGAVYAVMLAFAMFFPNRYIFIWFLVPVKAKYLIAFLIVMEYLLVSGYSGGMDSNIAHLAHLGGAFAGFLFVMLDRRYNFDFDKLFSSFGKSKTKSFSDGQYFRKPFVNRGEKVKEAKFYDINEKKKEDEIDQDEIDRILDKISQSGYQNLTEREKRILFEASKKN
jgi:membrane associated rhomboid family serine protease